MKNDGLVRRAQLAAALLIAAMNCQPPTARAQGSLTPPGPPAPTMKTLAQIEPRTPISSAPFTIIASGAYYLTTNLTVTGGDAITIAVNGVTLDLNGFTIASTAPSATGYGIRINGRLRNLAILNGFIQGGVTNNGSGVYSGPGFGSGISISGSPPVNTRVTGVSVAGCLDFGIYLETGDSTLVESCTAQTVGNGIIASTIKASVVKDSGGTAIFGRQVIDCWGESTHGSALVATVAANCYGLSKVSGPGLSTGTAQNCYGESEASGAGLSATTALNCEGHSSSGIGLSASTAQNCRGFSTSSTGLYAESTALNCHGSSSSGIGLNAGIAVSCTASSEGSAYGLFASHSAQNCEGSSTSGTGLEASMAQNCRGSSMGSGAGLSAAVAQNCIGSSSSGTGVNADRIAIGCFGFTSSGTGLKATIANSCLSSSAFGPAQDIVYKYDMP